MNRKKKIIFIFVTVLLIGLFVVVKFRTGQVSTPQYQTAKVERGTIVSTVAVSGQVSTANNVQVTTKASGVIKNIYVENGQKVTVGQKMADLELDLEGQQRAVQAFASYQSAKDSLYSLQSSMLTKWKTYMDTAQSGSYQNPDGSARNDTRQLPQFVSSSDDWLATEAVYKNQQNQISSAWLSYQQTSPIIYAPISGTVTGFSLQLGSVITAQSNSSGGSTAQKIASVKTEATPTITTNLTEIDVPKIKIGDKASMTLDAFPDKTFTGKVVSIDTVGAVTSGVVTYPTVISLDTGSQDILTNMSVQAKIITDVKNSVLMVPASAVSVQNGQSTVKIMKNGQVQSVNVETGVSSGTSIEIVSGLSEGDDIVTSSTLPGSSSQRTGQTTSVFGSFGGGGGAGRLIGR